MRAGDVLLFHRKTFSPMTALIQLVTRSKWNHAALALDSREYIEATSGGVRKCRYSGGTQDDEILVVPMTYADRDDLMNVLAYAAGRLGVRYGYFNAFMCGLRQVIPGLTIKAGDSVICSELVAEALERAGHGFGKDTSEVSPGDLGEYLGVGR